MKTRKYSSSIQAAFTLIELLASMTVLVLIFALLANVLDQTQKVSSRVQKRVETFRETRAALEAMARRTSLATLNSYWGYDDPDRPVLWKRQSELHFATEHADASLSTTSRPASGHAIFFQAPFGYAGSEASAAGDPRMDYLDGLLNGWGYYVEFNSDLANRTTFLQGETLAFPERKRFRLMELRIPSEHLEVMKPSISQSNGLPAISLEATKDGVHQWFTDADIRSKYARPIAENVLALLISPRIPDGRTLEGDSSIAPNYSYDSRLFQYEASDRANTSRHQLPGLLDITLVATDEISWLQFQDQHGSDAVEDLQKAIKERFQSVSDYDEDLEGLKGWMFEKGLDPRIFRISITLRGAKFTTEFDA